MPPTLASLVADALLLVHAGVVVFVVGVGVLVFVGGRRGWRWVRRRTLRIVHVLLMVFIAAQAWLGQLCPLTVWEQALRSRAGEPGYSGSFIEYWVGELLYLDAPWWAFVAAYSAFAALVISAWWLVPPQRSRAAGGVGPGT